MADVKKSIRNWCAKQERSSFEVAQKLVSWNISNEMVHEVLQELKDENFLNDRRFAEDYSRGKFRIKSWGKKKIRLFLQQKKISEVIIDEAIDKIDEDEYLNTLNKLAEKRAKTIPKELPLFEKKGKIYQFLLSKGYESHLVRNVIDNILVEN